MCAKENSHHKTDHSHSRKGMHSRQQLRIVWHTRYAFQCGCNHIKYNISQAYSRHQLLHDRLINDLINKHSQWNRRQVQCIILYLGTKGDILRHQIKHAETSEKPAADH